MNDQELELTDEEIARLYGALRSRLNSLSVQNIRNTAAAAGIDVSQITAKAEARTGLGSRAEVMPAVDRLFGQLSRDAKKAALRVLADQLATGNSEDERQVQEVLGRHGFQFIDGSFVPVGLLDAREARFLPASSASELARAMTRLAKGDESGAITAACGAVDVATQTVYERDGLGDPGRVAFQAKVNTALNHLRVFEKMKDEIKGIGVSEEDANSIVENLREATNAAAQALQVARRSMGDVHGSKPGLRAVAYEITKWAAAISGLLRVEP